MAVQLDKRNHLSLMDEERRAFLANIPGNVSINYSRLYARYFKLLDAEPRYARLINILDRNLVLSGSKDGERARQVLEGIKAENANQVSQSLFLKPYTPTEPAQASHQNGNGQSQKQPLLKLR